MTENGTGGITIMTIDGVTTTEGTMIGVITVTMIVVTMIAITVATVIAMTTTTDTLASSDRRQVWTTQ
ncbi:hypothetical protein ASD91_07205 [Pseudomonas sp. Root68]|nr:hypothetical protein ASD91_07205 [Pseudomonas sp. Root68]KRB66797.1 hypothetical protein ASD95_08470 [Pseudomonas sp. Root71]